ncbi:hypothetical protein RIR_jg27962.t4 [Rhizophagus irregularis DAOM 181602=DAOM 197198]|nr:hypothetical protein RIR_jg27962.t4 [Rhizophagus irregularis DAOM 181602=DAOM 197198]
MQLVLIIDDDCDGNYEQVESLLLLISSSLVSKDDSVCISVFSIHDLRIKLKFFSSSDDDNPDALIKRYNILKMEIQTFELG